MTKIPDEQELMASRNIVAAIARVCANTIGQESKDGQKNVAVAALRVIADKLERGLIAGFKVEFERGQNVMITERHDRESIKATVARSFGTPDDTSNKDCVR